ncbi:F-box domain-containing protein [Mycena venus]|uniref:F-box domain-containing protein n=1 Tax=Mycena venus TaxID=2733690 RepID=A0A8H7D398_9AGAR|nr:F-box domain-containing protein [Mycena venus]
MNGQASTSISSLASELLVAIAAAGQESDRALNENEAFKPEWVLSHTSSRFREAMIDTPALWTLVEVDLDAEGSVEIAKLYLERSRVCKIRANLCHAQNLSPDADADDVPPVITERFRQIIPHIHRIWWLSIALAPEWAELLLAPLRDMTAPNLQHLEVSNEIEDRLYRVGSCRPIELFSSGAPRLTFVKLVGFVPFPMPGPPWIASLKHLELRNVEADGPYFVELATQCISLAHLSLDMRDIPIEGEQLDIPSLKSLHIAILDGEDDTFLSEMVDVFNTPALTELLISNAHGEQIFPLFNSTSLPHASFPALTSLCFSHGHGCSCEEDSDEMDDLHTISAPPLELFPSLSSLTLINQCFTANLVKDILGPHVEPWPLLQTIALSPMEGSLEAVSDALRIAIHSKQQSGQVLPKFRLAPALASLEDWQDLGADVEVFDPWDILHTFWSP